MLQAYGGLQDKIPEFRLLNLMGGEDGETITHIYIYIHIYTYIYIHISDYTISGLGFGVQMHEICISTTRSPYSFRVGLS